MDGYWVCPNHGDLFVQRDVPGDLGIPRAADMEPVRDDVAKPREYEAIKCPLCRAWLHSELRP